ncbi:hypothetical protein N8810_04480 [Flavobacteriaceae bacterium]|nr:hypothetical protein [Flavobacteriaceae bacterium]
MNTENRLINTFIMKAGRVKKMVQNYYVYKAGNKNVYANYSIDINFVDSNI